jgi:carbonic anhydrase
VTDPFDDVLAANDAYAESYDLADVPGGSARGLAIVTCIDSRIEPLRMLGLQPGDAPIIRTAGARVSDEVLRTLVMATHLLDAQRVMIVAHTQCRAVQPSDEALHDAIQKASGVDTRSIEFGTRADVEAGVRADVRRVRSHPLLPADLPVGGFVYEVETGRLRTVVGVGDPAAGTSQA